MTVHFHGNGARVAVVAVGDVLLSFHVSVLVLRDVLFFPEFGYFIPMVL